MNFILCSFLGYIIQNESVMADPEKVRVVLEQPVLGTWKELQHIFGFASFYQRFIQDYSSIASTPSKLMSLNMWFRWFSEAHTAFSKLMAMLTFAPVLFHPYSCKQFIMEFNAWHQ